MTLLDRYRRWRSMRRHEKHVRWLRKMRVLIPREPHHSARRNGPEALT